MVFNKILLKFISVVVYEKVIKMFKYLKCKWFYPDSYHNNTIYNIRLFT